MLLSVIIVNYNSRPFLEICLPTIEKAAEGIETEIIVVDNNSIDDSRDFLSLNATSIKCIFNSENIGFAKACNQGFFVSSGRYILFLNPDTILTENCFKDCLSFFEKNSNAGAVGVRMINGDGVFLKESKRGLPSPASSFYKLFGMAALFPRSKKFANYYLGHLPEKSNNPVDILSGAFMMIKREAFEKTGGFDEDFFMYGEDIDLSFRITKAGYINYYLGTISITHLKGGSTRYNKKYIDDFYGAMKLFVKKHYNQKPKWQRIFLNVGISFRKTIAKTGLIFR